MGREELETFRRNRQDPSGRERTVTGAANRYGVDQEPQEEFVDDRIRNRDEEGGAVRFESESAPERFAPERSPQDVFQDHQSRVRGGDLEGDFRENYAEDSVLVTGTGIHRGREAVRAALIAVDQRLVGSVVENRSCFVHGELAFAEWEACTPSGERVSAAETFVIRSGRIVAQTLHYEAE